jgi:MFS transporter, DHA1 family, multidrug resistance protein
VIVGILLGSAYISRYTFTTLGKKVKEYGKLVPEDRLPPMIVGAGLLPFGLFWFASVSSPTITAWPQIIAGVPIGAGIQIISLQCLAYTVDIYSVDANSAISGTIIVRSLIGGLFPLFAIPMYRDFGVCWFLQVLNLTIELITLPVQVAWASTCLGFVGVLFFPASILLYFYGARIRSLGKYVPRS